MLSPSESGEARRRGGRPAGKGLARQRQRKLEGYTAGLELVAGLGHDSGVKRAVVKDVLFGGRATAIM